MCFDVAKVVRGPGYDHGYDEESRNGRDVKIDILDDYVQTPEVVREVSDIYRSIGGLPEPPGEYNGPIGPLWRRGGAARAGHALPPPLVLIGQGGERRPPFLPLSLLLPPSPTPTRKGGVLHPVGVGLPPWRALLLGRPPPPSSFIYGGGGHPRTHKLIVPSRVRCPLHHIPPRSYRSSA